MVKNVLFTLLFVVAIVGCSDDVDDEPIIPVPDLRKTFIPDDNFEKALIELGYDDVLDDYVLTSAIEKIPALDISNRDIKNITGINDFGYLRSLDCGVNQIKELNISKLVGLKELNCARNNLTSLNVSKFKSLTYLSCSFNQISELDLSNNPRLYMLSVSSNKKLSKLDLTQNILIVRLSVTGTGLKFLDLNNNLELLFLYCGGNEFTELDLSNNHNLRILWIPSSHIRILDLRNNINLQSLDCMFGSFEKIILGDGNLNLVHLNATDNPNLICIQVADEEKANSGVYNPYKLWKIDDGIIFSEDCP